MRIAFLPDGRTANAAYRSMAPMLALAERGHEICELRLDKRDEWHAVLQWCELLHIHRVCDGGAVELARAAKAVGATVVWDDDDDVTSAPPGTLAHSHVGGLRGASRLAARRRLFQSVDLVTTPSPALADVFRKGGAPDVLVIENYVVEAFLPARARRADVTVGWVAAAEHRLDVDRIPIAGALARLLDGHPHVNVAAIGIGLGLQGDRYVHEPWVPLAQLLQRVTSFDIGIAPLSPEIAINHSRSNIKLKEYAAAGVPWLASPIGPYAGLGEREGGRLVPDDGWFGALDALVRSDRVRRKLAKRAARWGSRQTLRRNVGCWERAFEHAVAVRRACVAA